MIHFKKNRKFHFTENKWLQTRWRQFLMGDAILVSIGYASVQTKLSATHNTQYIKNTSQNRSYVYADFKIALSAS